MIDPEFKRDVERVASLMREQKSIGDDIKEICKASSDAGRASSKEVRRHARESLMDPEVLQSQLERDDLLRHALGVLDGTPLGEATIKRSRRPQTDLEDAIEETEPPEAA
jgi:uncharacterized protein (UPF0335 family)